LDAGLYRLCTPKKYGGLEADMPTYARLIIEVSRGDPSTGWCWCLGHNHNLTTAAHWPAEAQEELFPQPGGYFRSSHSVAGNVTAVQVSGGYRVNGKSPYQSGVPYSTHSTVNAVLDGRFNPDGTPVMICAIIPIDEVTVLDDWGGDRTIGMRGSGSNSVVVEDVFVPERRTCVFDWMDHAYDGPSPGTELHGNPVYLGPVAGYFHMGLAAIVTGAAYAAVDHYEHILNTKALPFDPTMLRREDPQHQADLGRGLSMAESAEAIVVRMAEKFMEYATDTVERGVPFTMEMDARLYGMAQRAGEMAAEAVELLFRSAGSSAGTKGHPMERYYRDVAMYRGHGASQYAGTSMKLGQIRLGLRDRPI
ncbi:MAG: acyl-CoA dehydrogenase family protein, partial [Micromonosporaceae bacterium]